MDRFSKLFNNNPALMAINNLADNKFVDVNTAFIEKLGFSRDEIIDKTSEEIGLFDDDQKHKETADMLGKVGRIKNVELKVRKKDGQMMDGIFSGDIIDNQSERALLTVMMDITEIKNADAEMARQSGLIAALIDSIQDIVFFKDMQGIYLGCNPMFAAFVGKDRAQIIGKTDYQIFNKELADFFRFYDLEMLKHKKPCHNEEWITYPDGEKILVDTIKTPFWGTDGQLIGIIGVSRDITDRKRGEDAVKYLSFHDQLTGLYNRRYFEEELKRVDVERNLPITILMCDINGLKLANDAFGHAVGDELIRKTSAAIQNNCRTDDIIARTGGDEFQVILPLTNAATAEQVIQRIKESISLKKVGPLPVSISFGSASKTVKKQNIQDIIKSAEDEMYRFKLHEKIGLRRKSIDAIMNAMFEKNHDSRQHAKRVADLSELISRHMNISQNEINQTRLAGQMHDIGKIGLTEKILRHREYLKNKDWDQYKKYPVNGYRILSSASEFSEIALFVLEHQENWDGTGYPKGLKGEEISVPARIVAIADFL